MLCCDTGGEINIIEYWQRDEDFSSPPAPNSGGARTQSPPKLGDLGGFGAVWLYYEIFRYQHLLLTHLSLSSMVR